MTGTTHACQPEGSTDRTSQIISGQDPNHRNSGEITLTLSRPYPRGPGGGAAGERPLVHRS